MQHPIPDEALETDIAILAMKGAGKSYLAKGLAERILHKGRRFIAIDPLSHWWSLKVKADGSPGFPIAVIGGDHGDLPLRPDQGEQLGEFLANSDVSAVIDIGGFKRTDYIIFVTAFLDALYVHNKRALWLTLEEADLFAPQNPSADGTRGMGDTVDLIARRGRQRGFRLWTITQRPARLNKDVINMASTLVTLRTMGPLDRKAAEDWYLAHTDRKTAREIGSTLAGLAIGEGWVYSPAHDLRVRAKFPAIETLDTSSTPKAGEERPKDIRLATVELGELRAIMAATGGPVAAAKDRVAHAPIGVDHVAIDSAYSRGVADGFRIGLSQALAEYDQSSDAVRALIGEKKPADLTEIGRAAGLTEIRATRAAPALRPVEEHLRGLEKVYAEPTPFPPPPPPAAPRPVYKGDGPAPLGAAAVKLAGALARYPKRGLSWQEVCVVAGMLCGNGYFYGGRKQLIDRGLAIDEAGMIYPTEACIELAGGRGLELTRRAFKEIWGGRRNPAPKMFNVLCDAAGTWVSMADLAQAVELKQGNGFWYGGLSQLRDANLIEQDKDRARVIALIASAAA